MLDKILKDPLSVLTLKMTALLASLFVSLRVFGYYTLLVIAAVTIYGALRGKVGLGILGFAFFPVITMLNPLVVPRVEHFSIIVRLSSIAVSFAIVVGSLNRRGNEKPPLGLIALYFLVAFISSGQGYFPVISYFKLINFCVFLAGICAGVANIDKRPHDIMMLRAGFMALGILYVWGSIATLPFPAVAHLTSLTHVIATEGVRAAEEVFAERGGNGLFAGITAHSQFLGPCLGCIFGYVACDMLLIERKVSPLHALILLPVPVLIVKSQARIGIVTFAAALLSITLYFVPRIRIKPSDRQRVKNIVWLFLLLMMAVAVAGEIKSRAVSRLLRKTRDITSDERTLVEAFTASRQGKIYECMRDFRQNPLWGMGFQVAEEHREQYRHGGISMFSAPIEKGILPIMILGETGIIGAVAFLLFLLHFSSECLRRQYYTTIVLFFVLLASNLGEATFFSPGGGGGVFWIICVVGGFTIDMAKKVAKNPEAATIGVAPLNPHRRTRVPVEAALE